MFNKDFLKTLVDNVDVSAFAGAFLDGLSDQEPAKEDTPKANKPKSPSEDLGTTLTYIEETLEMVKTGEVDGTTALRLLRKDLSIALTTYAADTRTSTTEDGIRFYAEAVLNPATDLSALADRLHGWGTDTYEGPRDFYVSTDLEAVAGTLHKIADLLTQDTGKQEQSEGFDMTVFSDPIFDGLTVTDPAEERYSKAGKPEQPADTTDEDDMADRAALADRIRKNVLRVDTPEGREKFRHAANAVADPDVPRDAAANLMEKMVDALTGIDFFASISLAIFRAELLGEDNPEAIADVINDATVKDGLNEEDNRTTTATGLRLGRVLPTNHAELRLENDDQALTLTMDANELRVLAHKATELARKMDQN